MKIIIRELREEHGYKQEELAEIIHVDRSVVSRYETGDASPGLETLSLIADIFDVSADYILGRSNYKRTVKDMDDIEELRKEIGAFLKNKIKQQNTTQKRLALAINMDETFMSRVIQGCFSLPMRYVPKIAEELEMDQKEIYILYDMLSLSKPDDTDDVSAYLNRTPIAKSCVRAAMDRKDALIIWEKILSDLSSLPDDK